jgi:tetratricopeptide (TPR) repeat protein/transglutaminase-like putative cysteine protease
MARIAYFISAAALLPQPPSSPPDPPSDFARYDFVTYRDRVEADGSSTRTLEARVLLQTTSAVAAFGQLGLPYIDGYGDVQFERVAIEKPGGLTVEVRNGLIQDLNPYGVSGTSLAADIRYKKLTIPGLEPGDRLSFRVVLVNKPLSPGRLFGEMKLTPLVSDPIQTYELDLPRDATIRVHLRDGLDASWEDIPAPPERLVRRLKLKVQWLNADRQVPTKAAIQAWAEPDVMFTRFSSWSEVAQWWWALSRDHLKPDASVKSQAANLVTSKATPREKLEALQAFVATRIRYVNVSFGLGRMQPRPAPEVLDKRYGDCKDKYALLAALSSSVGLDVRPALINSARYDLRDEVPAPQQFDHIIGVARLGPEPGDWLWLDATNPLGMPGYLGAKLRDKRALLIEGSGEGRIVRTPAEPPFIPRTEVEVKGKLEPDGTLRGRVAWRLRSDEEVQIRLAFAAVPQDRRAGLVRASLAGDWKEGKVTNVLMSDLSDVAEALKIEFDVEKPGPKEAEEGNQGLWVPLPTFDLPAPEKTVPSAGATLDVTRREFSARAEIEIPEGRNARAPLSLSLDRPFGRFESSYTVEERHLRVARALKLVRRSVSAEELPSYEAFRKAIETDRAQEFSILGGVVSGPAGSPGALHKEGLTALEQKDYAKAVELLRKATEVDPPIKDGYEDLGRALRKLGKKEEALQAFSRQIEIDPFHELAFSERALILMGLGRWEEAEKDLLKQIDVAPFKAWSYQRLAERRMNQKRFHEAADLYSRAAALEPKEADVWLDLAWAHQMDGRADEARAALDRVRALNPADWLQLRAGSVYDALGNPGPAAELATSVLPSVRQRLAALSATTFGEEDLYWVGQLAEAWYLIGAAALATGDGPKADRYLDAAWKLVFLPKAAWALGSLRDKQGRLAEAVELWSMASSEPTASWELPADHSRRLDSARRRLPAAEQRSNHLMELRTIHLTGPVLADLTLDVLLLVGADGRVEQVRDIFRKNPKGLDRQLAAVGPIKVKLSRPDERAVKAVLRGLLACSHATTCAIFLDLPGIPPSVTRGPYAGDLTSLNPVV